METTINNDGIGTITFSEENELGRSGYARVYSGTFTTGDRTVYDVAVKRIETKQIRPFERDSMSETQIDNHPNILRYHNSLTDDNFTYLVTELCNEYTLQNFIEPPKEAKGKRHSPCPVGSTREIMRQITRGIEHFHKIGIEHRDIKPANLLISKAFGNIPPMIRLADFEFCFKINSPEDANRTLEYLLPFGTGTDGYMAPELYRDVKKRGSKEKRPFALDIFSAGCVLFVTFSGGEHPFGTNTDMRKENIKKGIVMETSLLNPKHNQLFFQLIMSMLDPVPSDRPTATEVLNNAFLNELLEFCEETRDWELPETIQRLDDLLANDLIDVKVRNEEGQTPLMLLCAKNQTLTLFNCVQKILNKETIGINLTDSNGNNALTLLCENYPHNNLIDILRLLIERDVDVNCTSNSEDNSNALLLLCTTYNHENLINIIQLLIEKGIRVNAINNNCQNALHLLCRYYQHSNLIEIVKLLLKSGIEVNARTTDGSTALSVLCQYYRENNLIEIIQFLIESGINVNARDHNGWNPLLTLCQEEDHIIVDLLQIANLLIDNKIYINDTTSDGNNALLLLARFYEGDNIVEIARLLIERGISLNAMNSDGFNADSLLRQRQLLDEANQICLLFI